MKFGVRIGCGKVDRVFRAAEMAVVAAIEQFALGVCKVEEWCFIRLDIAQRHNVEVDIGDLAPAVRHFVTQDAFLPESNCIRAFPARPSASHRPWRRYGVYRRPISRKAEYIRG